MEDKVDKDVFHSHNNESKNGDWESYFTDLVSNGFEFLLKRGLFVFDVKFLSSHTCAGVYSNSAYDGKALTSFNEGLC